MMYMQKYGHTPIVLIGGGTTLVGDPSGRTDMRQMMTQETIIDNGNAFKKLFDRFIEFDEDYAYLGSDSPRKKEVPTKNLNQGRPSASIILVGSNP